MEMTPGGGALHRFFRDQGRLDSAGCPQCGGHLAHKSELSAHEMTIGSCGVPGSLRKKSDMSSYQIALGSRPERIVHRILAGRPSPGFHKGLFLVSSVSVLANEGSVKDFSLWDGDSWCAFPAGLPSSCGTSSSRFFPSRFPAIVVLFWYWAHCRPSILGNVAIFVLLGTGRIDGNSTFLSTRQLWGGVDLLFLVFLRVLGMFPVEHQVRSSCLQAQVPTLGH